MAGSRPFTDGWATTALAAVLYPVGPAAIVLMPMIVGGLIDGYGYTEQQAGNVAALEGLGLVVSSAVAAAWIRRVSWVRALWLAAAAYAAINLASGQVTGYLPLLALRFAAGLAGGNLFAVSVAALGDGREPDRAFGVAQAVQGVLMLGAFAAAPALLAAAGPSALYGLLAAFALLAAAVAVRFPDQGRHAAAVAGDGPAPHTGLIALGLVASVVFFVNVFGCWAFVERIGQAGGLPPATIGIALGASQVVAIGGALAAAAAGNRFGRYLPLLAVAVGQVLALGSLFGDFGVATYFAATGIFQACFVIGVAYQMGAIASLDVRGRFLVMMTAAQGLGSAIGPAVAGGLIRDVDYAGVLWLALAACVASTLAFLLIVRRSAAIDAPRAGQVVSAADR
jgi:predicted MFS family arabinose efflux permease